MATAGTAGLSSDWDPAARGSDRSRGTVTELRVGVATLVGLELRGPAAPNLNADDDRSSAGMLSARVECRLGCSPIDMLSKKNQSAQCKQDSGA